MFNETYYLLEKNTTQKQIIYELRKKNINIRSLNWKLASLIQKKSFVPKAGEYLILKNSSVVQIQKLLQTGKTLTRSFTLVEGSTAIDLKNNLTNNPY